MQPNDRIEFMKLEHSAIMAKMLANREDLARTETVYPLAMIAVYGWLLTHTGVTTALWRAGMWLPALICFLGLVRIRGRLNSMKLLEEYSCLIEQEFYGDKSPGGWEHAYRGKMPMYGVGRARWAAAALLLAGSIAVGSYATFCLAGQEAAQIGLPESKAAPR